jgi:hypothetical protein
MSGNKPAQECTEQAFPKSFPLPELRLRNAPFGEKSPFTLLFPLIIDLSKRLTLLNLSAMIENGIPFAHPLL